MFLHAKKLLHKAWCPSVPSPPHPFLATDAPKRSFPAWLHAGLLRPAALRDHLDHHRVALATGVIGLTVSEGCQSQKNGVVSLNLPLG